MSENADASIVAASCPWCSADLPPEAVATCPWCGATLVGEADAPGLTTLDPVAARRLARQPVSQRRNRLVSWITGDDDGDSAPAAPGSLAPPPPEVQREMLRMQLEARAAELEAEAGALAADAHEAGDEAQEEALRAVAVEAAGLHVEAAEAPEGPEVPEAEATEEPAEPTGEPNDAAVQSTEAATDVESAPPR